MSSSSFQDAKRKLLQDSEADRARVRQLVGAGQWFRAETNSNRFLAYSAKHVAMPTPTGAEAIIGPIVDLQNVTFLTLGSRVRRAVAYVEVNDARESKIGSGFLVSPRLFLTNQHVIADAVAARGAQLVFDKETDAAGVPGPTTTYLLDPNSFALFSPETELDYAIVAVGTRNAGVAELADLGYCPLSDAGDKHVLGMSVNIIQHPRGWPKMLAIRNNLLTFRTEHTLLYETDTEEGSSGSPVFNDDWQLIALHHWAGPALAKQDVKGEKVPSNVNEGVRISAIYEDLKARLPSLSGTERALLTEALSLASDATGTAVATGPQLSGPRTSNRPENSEKTTEARSTPVPVQSDNNELVLTIPVQVSVRIAGGMTTTNAPSGQADGLREAPKVLTSGAEALQLDADYSNRTGYDPEFIQGEHLPLPTIGQALAGQLAQLHPDVPGAAAGELKYEHFSLKLNKAKRIAFFTATNIDGETFLDVDRKTGLVAGSEGETWFKDPRISASYFLDQTFYSAWSTYFDRGHLTRRTDPTWGTPKEAERANADTFHFTNCSPQHFRFNEAAKFWQGVERYVLENGVLSGDAKKKRLCVFQGPIFTDAIDHRAEDVQIPSSFFKIVVWKGAKLKAVGLVVDQLPLLSETRKSLGAPKDLPSVDVNHWRIGIAQIEKRIGLDFGKKVRDADTIATASQPHVGEEAGILIRRLEDIRL